MVPTIIKPEYDALNDMQKQKFHQLLSWSAASSLSGVPVPITTYEHILKMVKQMGEEPITPIEPDRTVNHDWHFAPVKK